MIMDDPIHYPEENAEPEIVDKEDIEEDEDSLDEV